MSVLFFPFAPSAASVNELSDGSFTPRNTSSPLMLKTRVAGVLPAGPDGRLHEAVGEIPL